MDYPAKTSGCLTASQLGRISSSPEPRLAWPVPGMAMRHLGPEQHNRLELSIPSDAGGLNIGTAMPVSTLA